MTHLKTALTTVVLIGTLIAWTVGASAAGDGPTYVGSKTCKKCHLKHYKSWEKTTMSQTLEVLKIEQRSAEKTAAKLDPQKDYTTDPECLKCHTVGFGVASGYAVPPADDKKAQRRAQKLAGVGCEACHGPGSEYVKLHKEVQDQSRKYKLEEMYAAGMTKIGPDVCATCHNSESPFVGEDYVFDYEKKKDEGTHEHFELKYRGE